MFIANTMVWINRSGSPLNGPLVIALVCATVVKLYLALAPQGSLDVAGFLDHLQKIREFGVGAYRIRGVFNNPFNSPPPMIHVISLWGWLADSTGLPFRFWLRLPSAVADIGSFVLVARWLIKFLAEQNRLRVLMCLALCPTAILISGFHGNTDSVMIFFVLLSIYLIETAWLAGLVFGLALCIKVAPFIFLPAILFYLSSFRKRLIFLTIAVGVFLLCSLPYIASDPRAVFDMVFGYSSIYGPWGWPQLAVLAFPNPTYLHGRFDVQGSHATFASILKYVNILSIVGVSLWLNLRKPKPDLLIQCGLIIAIFLFLTPGFGAQYLIWLVPFVTALGLRATLLYYVTSSLVVVRLYTCVAFGACLPRTPNLIITLICWLSVAAIILIYRRRLQGDFSANQDHGASASVLGDRDCNFR